MATVQHAVHDTHGAFEPSLFGTYSKKVGMWLFLASDSLTFGALLFAYSYGRISNPAWPTPFGKESIANATIMTACLLSSSLTMVLAGMAANRGRKAVGAQLAARHHVLRRGFYGVARPGMDSTDRRQDDTVGQSLVCRAAVWGNILYAHRHAHAACHHRRDLSGRNRVAEKVPSHAAGFVGARIFPHPGGQRIPLRHPRAPGRRYHFGGYSLPQAKGL